MLTQIEGFDAAASRHPRRKTYGVKVGHVCVGGGAPIVVQSMTNTDTADIATTLKQTLELSEAGSEIVRWTVNVPEAAAAVPEIKKRMLDGGCTAPIIGDFHDNRTAFAPGPHRSGHGHEGTNLVGGFARHSVVRRHWRYDSHFTDPQTRRRSQGRSLRCMRIAASAGIAFVCAQRDSLPRLRTNDKHHIPGIGRSDPRLHSRQHANLEDPIRRR